MTSSSALEIGTFLCEFITSHARSIFAAFPLSENETEPLVFLVYSNLTGALVKCAPFPASKSSIESLLTVTVPPEELEDCLIYLTELAGEVKQMSCKHRHHAGYVMKWLGTHGSCPVCMFQMPVDDEEEEKWRSDDGVGWQVVVTVTSGGELESESDMEIDLGGSMDDLD